MTRCLQIPAFRRLLAAYVFNELAWSVGTLALSVLVYRRTGSAIGTSVFFLCSQVIPALLSPALVARLDRGAPRTGSAGAVRASKAPCSGSSPGRRTTSPSSRCWRSRSSTAPIATTARSLASAARAEILKPANLLHEGNAVANFGFSAAFMVGPVLGGLVVVAGGTIAALLVNCCFFGVMAVILSLTPSPAPRPDPGSVRSRLAQRAGPGSLRRGAQPAAGDAVPRPRLLHDHDSGRGRLHPAHAPGRRPAATAC